MEHLLADIGADDAAAEALPAVLRTLRRRDQLRHTSAALRARWCERLTALMRSHRPQQRCAGAALAAESVHQLDEPTFAAFRDAWVGALISMATQRGGDSSSRRHAAGALAALLAATARFPSQRREMAPHAPRVVNLLLSTIERDPPSLSTSAAANGFEELSLATPDAELRALASLRLLSRCCPHVLRPARDRVQHALVRLVLEPTRDGSAPHPLTTRAVTAAAELLASLPSVVAGSGPAYGDAWLSNMTLLLGALQAVLARAFGSVTDRPLSRMPLLPLGGAGADGRGLGGGAGSGVLGGGAPSYSDGPRGRPGAGVVGLAEAVGRGATSALAEREAIVCTATGLVRAVHACLHPPVDGLVAVHGVPAGGGATAPEPRTPVPIPVRAMCELGLMVLAHDGALPLPVPAAGSLPHASLRAILPECHVLALQLLHSVLRAARRQTMPHAEAICDAIQLCWRRTDGFLRCPRLRCAAYELASSLFTTLGGSVAPHLVAALADAATADLGGARDEGGDAGWATAGPVSGSKRSRGGAGVLDFTAPEAFTFTAPEAFTGGALEAVQVAAARSLQALLCNAGSLTPYDARLRCQHCLLTLAEAAEAPPTVFPAPAAAPSDAAAPPPPPRASARLLAPVLRALHASVCTGESSPQALARTLFALRAARDGSGSAHVVTAATEALHSLEALIHPSGVPRWPRPLHTSVHTSSLPTPGLSQPGQALVQHSVPPLGIYETPPPAVPPVHHTRSDPTAPHLGCSASGALGSVAGAGTPQAGADVSLARAPPSAPASSPPGVSAHAPSPHLPPPVQTTSASSAGAPSQPPLPSVARPAAHPAPQHAIPSATAPPSGAAAAGEESDSSDPEIMLDGPDGG